MKKYTAIFRDGAIATCRSNEVLTYAWRTRRPGEYPRLGFSSTLGKAQRDARRFGRTWWQILFSRDIVEIEIAPLTGELL